MPIKVTDERFEELVVEALESIPADLAEYMENLAVFVDDWPSRYQQASAGGMLLGLYQGVALTRRGPLSYHAVMPDRITIFKGPHCRITATEDDLRHRIASTVIHEVGHHFGISDSRLRELGW
jgi:predicted Zn-dependent protease with MMP-like domain